MISAKNIACLEEDLKESEHLLGLFRERVENSSEITTDGQDPEQERKRILKLISSRKKNLSTIREMVTGKRDIDASNNSHPKYFSRLKQIGQLLQDVRSMAETLAFDQYECKLNLVKQELCKSLNNISGLFPFITPNIRNEISILTKHYRIPSHTQESIIPELEQLLEQVEEGEITLDEFTNGYEKEGTRTRGYDDLRVQGGVFSRYQFYENSPQNFGEINFNFQKFLKPAKDFVSKRIAEPDFRKILDRMNKLPETITRSNTIFEIHTCINLVSQKVGKKYSFHERFKELAAPLEEFNQLKNTLIYYHEEAFDKKVQDLEVTFKEEADLKRFEDIIEEVRKQLETKIMPFEYLPSIFKKLAEKDFNIVLQQKDADDITIEITPHHEQKFGRKNLERVNIIIQEIDFWYPIESKQLLFQDLSLMTRKFQNDEAIDEKRFYQLIKSYDKEIEKNTRIYYPRKIKFLKTAYTLFHNFIMKEENRRKLASRLNNPKIWPEIGPRLKAVSKSILVLNAESPSLAGNVNKFVFIKLATQELCQLLYDLSMQLFAAYRNVDIRSVGNMTTIISVYNEFYDVYSLWSVFDYYFKKNHINNFSINEDVVIQVTKSDHCQARLSSLFPKSEPDPPKTSG
jgi:hypothetical protein